MARASDASLRRNCVAAFALAWLFASSAWSQADDTLYESQQVERTLRREGLVAEPEPEGKRIAYIEVVREPVLVGDELLVPVVLPRFAPTWPNILHVLTRERIVRRELLIAEGESYRSERVEESMRNLRALGVFALVGIVAVQTSDKDRVGVLVYTRDLWSLRFETEVSGAGTAFGLHAQLIERNFLGRNKQLSASFDLDPKSYSVGEEYLDARVMGSELSLDESLGVIVNRESGRTEGSEGLLRLERPFRNLSQAWAWSVSSAYAVYVQRALRGSEITSYRVDTSGATTRCATPARDCLRSVYDSRGVLVAASGSYRTGERYKQTWTLGAVFSDREVRANQETALLPGQEAAFEREILPRTRRQVYPRLSYELWLPNYVVYRDLATFGHSESVRVGPQLSGVFALPLRAFGSSSDSATFASQLGYVLGDGRGLAEAAASASARLENGRVVDQALGGLLRGATPSWFLGRLVGYVDWSGRRRDTAKTQVMLGGDNGLRGYISGAISAISGNLLRVNVEYRSQPLVWQSVHFGGVLFYDGGSAYTSLTGAQYYHAAGVGLRVLLPQFNLTPFRADLGMPIDSKGFSVLVSYGTEQAVPLTAGEDAAIAANRSR
jgi:outer membrane translocation and assembly module TamA